MIFRPTSRGAGTIYHYLANFILRRDHYKGKPSLFHGTLRSNLVYLPGPPSVNYFQTPHLPVTVASFDQVLATRESFESIARELGSCNFLFLPVRRKLQSGHRSLKFWSFAHLATHEGFQRKICCIHGVSCFKM